MAAGFSASDISPGMPKPISAVAHQKSRVVVGRSQRRRVHSASIQRGTAGSSQRWFAHAQAPKGIVRRMSTHMNQRWPSKGW